MALLDLPTEILLSIAGHLIRESDINALAQTNRRFYILLNFNLYRYAVERNNHLPLNWAAFHGFTSIACTLLAEGASVRATTVRGKNTALHFASKSGHLPIVEALIQMGADISAQSSAGLTPLHEAVKSGYEGVAQALLDNGADYMKALPGGKGLNVLHVASSMGHTPIVRLLLGKGMGIETKDKDLQTPLHYAVKFDDSGNWSGNLETVEFLLMQKANKDAWDRLGRRPKDLAKSHPNIVVELLFLDFELEMAVMVDQQWQARRVEEEARKWKKQELTAERAASREMRSLKNAQKFEKGQLHNTMAEEERQICMEREKLADIASREREESVQQAWAKLRYQKEQEELRKAERQAKKQQDLKKNIPPAYRSEKIDATMQAWSQMRANAEEQSHQPSKTTKQPLCPHPSLGWLKSKRRVECGQCGIMCTKYSFMCGDCGLVACLQCKVNACSIVDL